MTASEGEASSKESDRSAVRPRKKRGGGERERAGELATVTSPVSHFQSIFSFYWSLTMMMAVIKHLCIVSSYLTWQSFAFTSPSLGYQPRSFRRFMADDENIDNLRSLLEASWNTETMGCVPTNAESASDAAASALLSALDQDQTPIFFVDILLPQYDITHGTNLYDEVLAVEFCMELAKKLKGDKSEIIVRDSKVLNVVNRIFDAREGSSDSTAKVVQKSPEKSTTPRIEDEGNDIDFYDDFADFRASASSEENTPPSKEPLSSEPSTSSGSSNSSLADNNENPASETQSVPTSDIDSFREQLMSSWELETADSDIREEERIEQREQVIKAEPSPDKCYRLTSMLGDATISSGTDMMDDVMSAVKANALPNDDEDTIIILSAITREELYAVRALVDKYKRKKKIVLVNCKLDPMPRELFAAQTVYSVLPLIARPSATAKNTDATDKSVAPQVVVLRRYPRDWEVYVNVGNGFELAASVPARSVDKKGPAMEWISSAVKRYLQSR